MQTTFSFYRLGLLIRKQWAERARLYILMMAAIAGLLAVAFFLWGSFRDDNTLLIEPLQVFLFVGLFLGGCIIAGMTFSDLSQRTTGIYYLGVPATHAEKLVCGILFSQVFFNAAYLLIFYLLREIAFVIVAMNPHLQLKHIPDAGNIGEISYYVIIVYAAVQTVYLLGSVYFERFAFVKTTVSVVLLLAAFTLFAQYVIARIMPQNHSIMGVGVFQVEENGGWYTYTLPLGLSRVLWFLGRYMWAPVFWAVAYFRLKEKEI